MKDNMKNIIIKFKSFVTSERQTTKSNAKFYSLCLFLVCLISTFLPQTNKDWCYFGSCSNTLFPSFQGILASCFLVTPLIIRNIIFFSFSTYGYLSAFFSCYFIASLFTLVIEKGGYLPWVIGTIVLSWLGMKLIAFLCQIIAVVIFLWFLFESSSDMLYYEPSFILYFFSGVGAIMLNQKTRPDDLVKLFLSEFSDKIVNKMGQIAKENTEVGNAAIAETTQFAAKTAVAMATGMPPATAIAGAAIAPLKNKPPAQQSAESQQDVIKNGYRNKSNKKAVDSDKDKLNIKKMVIRKNLRAVIGSTKFKNLHQFNKYK